MCKLQAKQKLAAKIKHLFNVDLDNSWLFDVQVKRIHEYKRQQMNAMYMIHRYLTIKDMSPSERQRIQKRVSFVGGKAAPGYFVAKTIIKLINNISEVINNDPDVSPYYKVFFIPNYNVTNAQVIIPASDISQHISTAGTEASGTSNMKFVMNGGLIVGTMDGANVEIRQECGDDTIFIFGALEDQVAGIRAKAQAGQYPIDPRLQRCFEQIRAGRFSGGDDKAHHEILEIINKLTNNGNGYNGDNYLVCHDFPSFCDAQERADRGYQDKAKWT